MVIGLVTDEDLILRRFYIDGIIIKLQLFILTCFFHWNYVVFHFFDGNTKTKTNH